MKMNDIWFSSLRYGGTSRTAEARPMKERSTFNAQRSSGEGRNAQLSTLNVQRSTIDKKSLFRGTGTRPLEPV